MAAKTLRKIFLPHILVLDIHTYLFYFRLGRSDDTANVRRHQTGEAQGQDLDQVC